MTTAHPDDHHQKPRNSRIDGVDYMPLRATTGVTHYWTNNGSTILDVGPGVHTITVQYRTNQNGLNSPIQHDYHARNLTVTVLVE